MEQFIIEGGIPLKGEITPAGNKNAALPLMAACLLTDEPVILRNVPDILDVQTMRSLFESMGVTITDLEPHVVQIDAKNSCAANLDLISPAASAASILLAGPHGCARRKFSHLPPPGGCDRPRRVDTHLLRGSKNSAPRCSMTVYFIFKSNGFDRRRQPVG